MTRKQTTPMRRATTPRSRKCIAVLGMYSVIGPAILTAQSKPTSKTIPKITTQHSWANEPDSFHGARFGGSEAETREHFSSDELGQSKTDDVSLQKLTDIGIHFDLADTYIDGFLIYHDSKFVGVVGLFPVAKFPVVQSVFVERYGKALGYQLGTHSWRGKAVSLLLRENATAEDRNWVQLSAQIRWEYRLAMNVDGQRRIDQMILEGYQRALDNALQQYSAGVFSFVQYKARTEQAEQSVQEQEAESRKTTDHLNDSAKESYDKFKSGSYGFFSLTTNDYIEAEVARQKSLQTKAASKL